MHGPVSSARVLGRDSSRTASKPGPHTLRLQPLLHMRHSPRHSRRLVPTASSQAQPCALQDSAWLSPAQSVQAHHMVPHPGTGPISCCALASTGHSRHVLLGAGARVSYLVKLSARSVMQSHSCAAVPCSAADCSRCTLTSAAHITQSGAALCEQPGLM